MVEVTPLWCVLLAPVLLVAFAAVAVTADGLLAARAAGLSPSGVALTPLPDVARALVAQRRISVAADRLLWRIGVVTLPVAAVLAVAVVPLGNQVSADLDVGVLWFNAMEVLAGAALWLLGWGPNAAFSLVGGYRFVAQGLAYQLPLMFSLVAAAAGAQSLRVGDVVAAQRDLWFVVWMPLAFVIFLISVLAFSFLAPFDYPAGRDIGGGVLAAAGGIDGLVLRAGRWMLLTAGAAMAVPLFLGGGAGPVLPA